MLENCRINNYEIISQIGSGSYSLVFHVKNTVTNDDLALKCIFKSNIPQMLNDNSIDERKKQAIYQNELETYFKQNNNVLFLPNIDLESIMNLTDAQLSQIPHYREIALHLKVHEHKNIVTIHQVLQGTNITFMLMDYYPIDLFTSVVDQRHFANDGLLIKKVFLQLCSALKYCHKRNIFHCDIKPENLLLDSNDNVYVCDFGLATNSNYFTPNVCIGSSYYMAPERLLYSSDDHNNSITNETTPLLPNCKGDIWSLGIILINLVCIRNPWLKAHQLEDTTFHYFVKDSNVLKKILPISDDLYELLLKMFELNPYHRIVLDELMVEMANIKHFEIDGPLQNVPILSKESYEQFSSFSVSQSTSCSTQKKERLLVSPAKNITANNYSSYTTGAQNEPLNYSHIDDNNRLSPSLDTTPYDSDTNDALLNKGLLSRNTGVIGTIPTIVTGSGAEMTTRTIRQPIPHSSSTSSVSSLSNNRPEDHIPRNLPGVTRCEEQLTH
ncbi:putative serine/threonine protein kinase VHS1 NDAI_0C05160 [Naumovozyma dairenensis CBS 421]|uniref:non-specific serine/threonine protein kinase n=1 Tax=Naumovozyma dairenensis (strain ATCC 10597 / BCRC 20456 / CBS 421 / NBRC 0211 / NRRL Y-12639) TaxID=1071378 RepID=G0W8R4_NAUDC|nr:hypothetical protein NDAI_0C05160 [Naumovozyma dairenensis CBS 421]CCD24175.1 hypothetical protein NDAI_0C05160 [Naumovozyma dairenensis CBS 421]